MKKKEHRLYFLWYFTSAMWLITFCVNLFNNKAIKWIMVIQFINIFVSLAAGIVNAQHYKKTHGNDKNN